MISLAIVDSGPLLAATNRADPDHQRCLSILEQPSLRLVIPSLCIAEVSYLLGRDQGTRVESQFLKALVDFDIRSPSSEEWTRIGELVELYEDLPLGGTDASVISLAESLETRLIVTLDRRHFSVIRDREGRPLELLP